MPTCGSSCLRHYSREVMTMAKPLGKGSVTRRDRDRNGKLRPRNKCRVWELSVKLDDGTRPTRTFHGTYSDACGALGEWVEELSGAGSGGRMRDLMASWHDRRKPAQARNTEANERSRINVICSHIGDMDVSDVTARDVERMYAALMSGDTLSGKPMSASSIRELHVTLVSFFADMAGDGAVSESPMPRVVRPRPEPSSRRAMPEDEMDMLMARLDAPDPRQLAVKLICAFGLRAFEACNAELRDWDGRSLSVRVSKTKAGVRSIPAPSQMARELDAIAGGPHDPIAPSPGGGKMRPADLGRWWKAHRADFGTDFLLHELRHSYATRLARHGVNPRVAQKLLGHSSLSTTLEVYTHVTDDMEEDAVARAFG